MAADNGHIGFCGLIAPATQDLTHDFGRDATRVTDDVQRGKGCAAHGVDITQGIRCGNLPKKVGVIGHGAKEIYRLHQGGAVIKQVDARVVAGLYPH